LSNVERQGVFAPPIDARRAPPPAPELIKPEDLIAIGKKAGVPVLIDWRRTCRPGAIFSVSSRPAQTWWC
jgi:hypothetical protein